MRGEHGEPWAEDARVSTLIRCADGDTASFGGHYSNAIDPNLLNERQAAKTARAIACVNACDGIDDPAAAIAAAREALLESRRLYSEYNLLAQTVECGAWIARVDDALRPLGGES